MMLHHIIWLVVLKLITNKINKEKGIYLVSGMHRPDLMDDCQVADLWGVGICLAELLQDAELSE